ncbi:uncharacterized protein V6R79_005668 [Siganus canaliculatus]
MQIFLHPSCEAPKRPDDGVCRGIDRLMHVCTICSIRTSDDNVITSVYVKYHTEREIELVLNEISGGFYHAVLQEEEKTSSFKVLQEEKGYGAGGELRAPCNRLSLPLKGSSEEQEEKLMKFLMGVAEVYFGFCPKEGNNLPPLFIFPRAKYQPFMVNGGPPGCIGTANKSGWMQEEDFLVFLQHFLRHTRATPEAKVILLLDNHASHLSIRGIDFCRENGVVLLSFPPHTSHKLQPLDRSVYGPLKIRVNAAIDAWMKRNPGRTLGIYDLPAIVATTLPHAATPANIIAGFRCTGIYPFNRMIFSDQDFSPCAVTDSLQGIKTPHELMEIDFESESEAGAESAAYDVMERDSAETSVTEVLDF